MQKELLTPAAILVGSVIIGAGLYFGLQGRAQPPDAATPSAPAPTRPEGSPPGAVVFNPPAPQPAGQPALAAPGAGLAPPPAAAEIRKKAEADAAKALEQLRPHLVKTCWEPSARKKADPSKAKYIFNMSFDPSGKEIARGISEVRGMERPDAAQCLRGEPLSLQIPPPGQHVGVDVELMLP